MKKRWRVLLLALTLLTAVAVLAAPADRFKGSINDGYDKSSVMNISIPLPEGTIIRIY